MSVRIDKALVAQRFSAAASGYDTHARHQQQIARRLVSEMPETVDPGRIVDLGCGTGEMTCCMARKFPGAHVTGIDLAPEMIEAGRVRARCEGVSVEWLVADAETISPEAGVDLIVSNCSLQWFQAPRELATTLARLLIPGGRVALAIPIEGTLGELISCVRDVTGRGQIGLDLQRPAAYGRQFSAGAWSDAVITTYRLTQWYPDPLAVLRAVQGIGAVTTGQGGQDRAPLSPAAIRRVAARYRRQYGRPDGTVPSTYDVVCIHARHAGATA